MAFAFAWVASAVLLIVVCLYAILLAGHLSFALSQGVPLAQVENYPWMAALLLIGLILLVAPALGGFFGMLTTQDLTQRVQLLVGATSQMAGGNYAHRVRVSGDDEIGQLEQQFNHMARQLAESIEARAEFAKQHAQFAERTRISRELHDAISQDLFSLRMATGGLQTALAPCAQANTLQPYIETLQEATTRMIQEMRALLLELRPGQLKQSGLAVALEELATAYRTRLGITVITQISLVQLDTKMELALLRLVQEAFTNAVRHADATIITLSLQPTSQGIECCVTDNGKGFDLATRATQHGLGLHLMEERVSELQGSFLLDTTPGRGTRIQVTLPFVGAGGDS
jgi:signal transduction histidine kinase